MLEVTVVREHMHTINNERRQITEADRIIIKELLTDKVVEYARTHQSMALLMPKVEESIPPVAARWYTRYFNDKKKSEAKKMGIIKEGNKLHPDKSDLKNRSGGRFTFKIEFTDITRGGERSCK
jgi:hypothetical protein